MPDRTRPIRKEICLNEQELSLIRHKMNQLGTRNFGAYARKMLIDGYIIKSRTGCRFLPVQRAISAQWMCRILPLAWGRICPQVIMIQSIKNIVRPKE